MKQQDTWFHITPCTTDGHKLTGLRIQATNREKTATTCAIKGKINGEKFQGNLTITEGRGETDGAVIMNNGDNHPDTQQILNTINLQLSLDNCQLITTEMKRILGE